MLEFIQIDHIYILPLIYLPKKLDIREMCLIARKSEIFELLIKIDILK